jgi:hypothetical protein
MQVGFNNLTMYTGGCAIDSDIDNIKSVIDSAQLNLSNPVCKKSDTRYESCHHRSNLMCSNAIPASFGSLVICQKQVNGKLINEYQTFYQDPSDCQDGNTFIKM